MAVVAVVFINERVCREARRLLKLSPARKRDAQVVGAFTTVTISLGSRSTPETGHCELMLIVGDWPIRARRPRRSPHTSCGAIVSTRHRLRAAGSRNVVARRKSCARQSAGCERSPPGASRDIRRGRKLIYVGTFSSRPDSYAERCICSTKSICAVLVLGTRSLASQQRR